MGNLNAENFSEKAFWQHFHGLNISELIICTGEDAFICLKYSALFEPFDL